MPAIERLPTYLKYKTTAHVWALQMLHSRHCPHIDLAIAETLTCGHYLAIYDHKFTVMPTCKRRWCPNCQRAWSMPRAHHYAGMFEDPWFVTLTTPTQDPGLTKEILSSGDKKIEAFRKQQKKKERDFKAIRRWEFTISNGKFKSTAGEIHLHQHWLVESEVQSERLIDHWLRHNPESSASAQKKLPAVKALVYQYQSSVSSS